MHPVPSELKAAFRKARKALLVCHANPDGDALGSMAALAHIAIYMGADARILLYSSLPDFLSWLPLPVPSVNSLASLGDWVPDLVCFADCGDVDRAGPELSAWMKDKKSLPGKDWSDAVTVNIDHHLSNPREADINWVEPGRAATGELVGMLAEELGMPLTGGMGQALYLALSSDTGNFTYSNTSADCLAMASRIVAAGLDIATFTNNYDNNWSVARMHLWGRLMSEIALHMGGSVAVSVVPRRYLDELGLRKADLEGFASWIRRLRGVRVSLFVREDAPGFSKISLRSMGDVNVQKIAAEFGGGGHAAAAGAEIHSGPETAAEKVLSVIPNYL